MRVFWSAYSLGLLLFFVAIFGRVILEWVQVMARDWRPRGAMLMLSELVYTVTDPPLKALRRVVPSPQIGGMRLDLSIVVLLVIVSLLMNLPALFPV